MKKLYTLFAVALGSILFFACGGKETTNSCTPTKANLTGTFSIKSESVLNLSTNTSTDILAQLPCLKDDHFIFKADSTYQYTYGTMSCGQADPRGSGKWYVSGNNLYIEPYTWSIVSYDCKTCVVTKTEGIYKYTSVVELQ